MEERSGSPETVLKKTWQQKISSKVKAINHYTPEMFVRSQWQKSPRISVYYLVYRWAFAIAFVSIDLVSIEHWIGMNDDIGSIAKWFTYFTHWGLIITTVQALLAVYLVARAHCEDQEEEAEPMKMNFIFRIYWVLDIVATPGALCISVIYWSLVYDPAVSKINAVNILVHVCNSILMIVDLVVIAHPFRLIDFYWVLAYSLCYSTFSCVYYLAGGTDTTGNPYVYKILNWQHPKRTLIILGCCILFNLFLFVCACLVSFLKCKIAQVVRKGDRARQMQHASNETPHHDFV